MINYHTAYKSPKSHIKVKLLNMLSNTNLKDNH